MYYQHYHPMHNAQSMNMDRMTNEILHRLAAVEMHLNVLLTQGGASPAFYKPMSQPMFQQAPQTHYYFNTSELFDAEAFKTQIELLVAPDGCSTRKHPIRKNVNHLLTMYIMDSVEEMVYIVGKDKIYASTKFSAHLPITKSNYKDMGLHHVFVGVFDKLAELEKSHGQPQHSDNRIDKTALLESILRLTEHNVASLPTITALYACYRWYDCFERDAPLAPSFKEELIKNHTALRKIKERSPYMTQAFKNLEEAFSSLLHHDGSVDFIDPSYPIQSAIHTTVDVLKSLISEEDE